MGFALFFSLQQFPIFLDIKKKLIILWGIGFLRYGYFSTLSGKIFFFDIGQNNKERLWSL